MIVFISTLILYFSYALPWLLRPGSKVATDPAKIMFLISGIMTLPYLTAVNLYPDLSRLSLLVSSPLDFASLRVDFALVQALSNIFLLVGVWVGDRVKLGQSLANPRERYSGSSLRKLACFSFVLALVLIAMKMNAAGGISNFLASIHMRASLLQGTGQYDILIAPAANLSVFLLLFARSLDGRPRVATIIFVLIVLSLSLSLFGGRKAPMVLVLTTILIATAYSDRLSLFSPGFMFAYLAVGLLFVGLYWFRANSAADAGIVVSTQLSVFELLSNISYLDTYLFVLYHFQSAEYWGFATLPELVTRFIPGFFPAGPPPLDDGVYIRTLFEGMPAEPGMAFESLFPSSWPPETIGFGYMNFGVVGVIGVSCVKGLVTGLAFKVARSRGLEPMSLFFAIFLAMNFHFTNLRVFQTIMTLLGLFLFVIGLRYARKSKKIPNRGVEL